MTSSLQQISLNSSALIISMATQIPVRPEYSAQFPAVDGIRRTKEEHMREHSFYPKEPIRSDIAALIALDGDSFNRWYRERKEATERLLRDYQLFSSIPSLNYGSEHQQHTMTAYTHVGNHLEYLKAGLLNLEKIKELYDTTRD